MCVQTAEQRLQRSKISLPRPNETKVHWPTLAFKVTLAVSLSPKQLTAAYPESGKATTGGKYSELEPCWDVWFNKQSWSLDAQINPKIKTVIHLCFCSNWSIPNSVQINSFYKGWRNKIAWRLHKIAVTSAPLRVHFHLSRQFNRCNNRQSCHYASGLKSDTSPSSDAVRPWIQR